MKYVKLQNAMPMNGIYFWGSCKRGINIHVLFKQDQISIGKIERLHKLSVNGEKIIHLYYLEQLICYVVDLNIIIRIERRIPFKK
jgi:hypothetical protein